MNNFIVAATYKDTGATVCKTNQMIFLAPDGSHVVLFDRGEATKKSVLYFEAFSEVRITLDDGMDKETGWIWNGSELKRFG